MGLPLIPLENCFDCIYQDGQNFRCKKHKYYVSSADSCFSFIKKAKMK